MTKGVHEPEMAVIIGKTARNVPVARAMDYVMGYTILNDVSSRDLPEGKHTSQGSTMSKGLDTSSGVPQPSVTFQEGQTVEIVVEGLGTLRNRVVSKPIAGYTRFPARKVE